MMSEEKHTFQVVSVWEGDSDGEGTLRFDWEHPLTYGVPAALGGSEGRSNPEELLLSAVVACYSITMAWLIERKRLPAPQIRMRAEGIVERQPDRTLKYTEIRLFPEMRVETLDAAQEQTLMDMAHKAERYCTISQALQGNVKITVEPTITRV